jgi:hypothetical protein
VLSAAKPPVPSLRAARWVTTFATRTSRSGAGGRGQHVARPEDHAIACLAGIATPPRSRTRSHCRGSAPVRGSPSASSGRRVLPISSSESRPAPGWRWRCREASNRRGLQRSRRRAVQRRLSDPRTFSSPAVSDPSSCCAMTGTAGLPPKALATFPRSACPLRWEIWTMVATSTPLVATTSAISADQRRHWEASLRRNFPVDRRTAERSLWGCGQGWRPRRPRRKRIFGIVDVNKLLIYDGDGDLDAIVVNCGHTGQFNHC